MQIKITNKASNKIYDIVRLENYEIENAMDIPADHFNIKFGNPGGAYSGLIGTDDIVEVLEENIILKGVVDDYRSKWDSSGSYINLDGRDLALLLMDNDAIPQTYYNLTLEDFIKKITTPYGFTKFDIAKTKVISKIVVDTGDTEWDIIFREAEKIGYWLWVMPDSTIVAQTLNYEATPSYTFSNEIVGAIHMESCELVESAATIKSEIWVRAQAEKTIVAKKKDQTLINKGFVRRRIIEDPESDNYSEAEKKATEELKDSKKGSYEIILETRGNREIKTNTTAKVIDPINKIDGVFFIVAVKHIKNKERGSVTTVRLRPFWEGL